MAPAELELWENVLATSLANEGQLIVESSSGDVTLGCRHDGALTCLPEPHGTGQGIRGIKTRE